MDITDIARQHHVHVFPSVMTSGRHCWIETTQVIELACGGYLVRPDACTVVDALYFPEAGDAAAYLEDPSRFCRSCGADISGNDPHGADCPVAYSAPPCTVHTPAVTGTLPSGATLEVW